MSNNESMGLDEFIGHTTSGGGRNNYLKGWKKNGYVECWLHKQASFVALWRHQLPVIRAFEDRDTKQITRKIWSQNWKCWEAEGVLTNQHKRDKKTGAREAPPSICPVCLLLEDVYQRVLSGRSISARASEAGADKEALKVEWKERRALALTAAIFRFTIDDENATPEEREVVLTAGGMLGLYRPDKLSDGEKAQLKKARIRMDEAWKESAMSKCSYVFTVVDNAHPEAGVQIAIEASLLGEKVKNVIVGERKRLGRDDGNPLKNPYPIRWEHHPKEKEAQKKYQAFALSTTGGNARPYTDEIKALIEGDAPNIENLKRNGNATTLRAQLEQYALVEFDWDAIFSQAEKLQASSASSSEDGDAGSAAPAGDDTRFDYGANAPAKSKPTIPCDKCGFQMAEDATKCPKCGTEYELVDEAPKDPTRKGGDVHNEADAGEVGDLIPWA